MTTEPDDDEELMFDQPPQPEPEPAEPPSPEPKAAAETPKADPSPAAQAEAPVAAPKRSKTGVMVAAGFAVCILASVTSAVMAWRAASLVAAANEGTSAKATAAKLDYLQRMMEQQRDTLDGMSTKPATAAAAAPSGGEGQLNALAAAVRANQEMNERLPSIIMKQVDTRLAGARAVAPRPAKVKPARLAKASPKPKLKPAVKTAAASKPIAPLLLQPIAAPAAPKRPAGEAIRYP